MRRYKKHYKEPHTKLKAALATLIALALSAKRRLILEYVSDHGPTGLMDYADTVLDSGWDANFEDASAILSQAGVDSSIETLDASGIVVTDEFTSNIEKHIHLIALSAAAGLLGLSYDPAHDIAVPTLSGWSIGQSLFGQLEDVLREADTEAWSSAQLDQAIGYISGFSARKAEQMAHDSLSFVDGASARSTASATGATMKRSESMEDDKVCPACLENQAMGWVGIHEKFTGSDTEDTPHHPNCRCSVEYEWSGKPEIAQV